MSMRSDREQMLVDEMDFKKHDPLGYYYERGMLALRRRLMNTANKPERLCSEEALLSGDHIRVEKTNGSDPRIRISMVKDGSFWTLLSCPVSAFSQWIIPLDKGGEDAK